MSDKLEFPKDFFWGAATSSHQVEGGQHNDWSEWEKRNADRLATESVAEMKTDMWRGMNKREKDLRFIEQAADPKNYLSGIACDQWNRYESDFDILKELHLNAYRFSLEWSRIEPEEGRFDEAVIGHYHEMISALRNRDIEPFVTLWHWTLPLWLAEKGGIASSDFPGCFERYATKIAESFGKEIRFFITLNEPEVAASHCYLLAVFPPQERSLPKFFRSVRMIISAHNRAYAAIKRACPEALIGIAKHQVAFEAKRKTPINLILKAVSDYVWNRWLLNRLRDTQDFIGLNVYNRNVIDNGFMKNNAERITDFGWEFFPEVIYHEAMDLKRYGKPVYVTESGIADIADTMRAEFIPRTLAAVHHAIEDGIDIRGYFYWSLLDNFEWDKGFWPRFGLVHVDFATQKRTVRDSARLYAKIAETNSIEI
jgi:beta-glucosidase